MRDGIDGGDCSEKSRNPFSYSKIVGETSKVCILNVYSCMQQWVVSPCKTRMVLYKYLEKDDDEMIYARAILVASHLWRGRPLSVDDDMHVCTYIVPVFPPEP